jgi:hypothetical protein
MLLQVMLFPFLLIGIGGIISLAAIVDPHHRRSAPRVGFPMFYAGLFSALLSFGLLFLVAMVSDHEIGAGPFIGGYLTGMIGGALLGYRLALKHKRHLINALTEADDVDDSDES